MVFNFDLMSLALLSFNFIWLIILTWWFVRIWRHYNRLTSGVSKTNLAQILETSLRNQEETKKQVMDLQKVTEKMQLEERLHLARVGIVRFNPFADTGGAQSFTLALLDSDDNGILMTSLYARTGNRWYIKSVREGRGVDLELSKEEEAAIKAARPIAQLVRKKI
ncbi:MAG: DUF4446 family protein [Patescibacteria group bacterium]